MHDSLNSNFILKRKNFNNLKQFAFLLKIIYFVSDISITVERFRNIINFDSKIHLVIIGNGNQNLLYSSFSQQPSQVFVNGIYRDSCKIFCELEYEENNVTLIFNNIVQSTYRMFYKLNNIKEIDLSFFDFSRVKSMSQMLRECTNLEKINFGNIDTSSVTSMLYLFHKCQKLISLDLSNFDTSSVTTMEGMFYFCTSLNSINLSSFNTSKVKTLRICFYNCRKLISLDLSNFDTSSVTNMESIFYFC